MSTATATLQVRDGQRHRVSLTWVVGLFFGFRVCTTLLLFRNDAAVGTAITLAASFVLLIASIGHWLALAPVHRSVYEIPAPVKWLATYLALAVVSLAWSSTPSMAIATAYWSGMAADVLSVLL